MAGYFAEIASQLGAYIWLLVVIIIWEAVWKLLALWKSARKGSVVWFIALAIFNTIGILPILYIFVFSKMGKRNAREDTRRVKKRKKK